MSARDGRHKASGVRTPTDPSYLRDLFNNSARYYESVNKLTSMGQVILWRKEVVWAASLHPNDRVLDAFAQQPAANSPAVQLGHYRHPAEPPGFFVCPAMGRLVVNGGDPDELAIKKRAEVRRLRRIVARIHQFLHWLMGAKNCLPQRPRFGC